MALPFLLIPAALPLLVSQLVLMRQTVVSAARCKDVAAASGDNELSIRFGGVRLVQRVALAGQIAAYHVHANLSSGYAQRLRSANGEPLVIYSTIAAQNAWHSLGVLAESITLEPVVAGSQSESDGTSTSVSAPHALYTVCQYDTPISHFDDSGYTLDSAAIGLSSMYENELTVVFRTFQSGVFLFSAADAGDLLVAQIRHGTVHVLFDFGNLRHLRNEGRRSGSLTPAVISAGRALDDGRWHEMRWLHQFDSVQLFIDGVLLNSSLPSGLYRKLDFHSQIHVAGRPSDDWPSSSSSSSDSGGPSSRHENAEQQQRQQTSSPASSAPLFSSSPVPLETSFRGCLARVLLNQVDVLAHAPVHLLAPCEMTEPRTLTLGEGGAQAIVAFSFLPFAFEFRTLPKASTLLRLTDSMNKTLLQFDVDEDGVLVMQLNITDFRQTSRPPIKVADGSWHSFALRVRSHRLEAQIDGITALWLEGNEVRRMSMSVARFGLSSPGCVRSTTVDLSAADLYGDATLGECRFEDRYHFVGPCAPIGTIFCLPNPCANGGSCLQTGLNSAKCSCKNGYSGAGCENAAFPRSCEAYFASLPPPRNPHLPTANPSTLTKAVDLDLDGGAGPLAPIRVVCEKRRELGVHRIVTRLVHDLPQQGVFLEGVLPAGSKRYRLDYGVGGDSLDRLVESFDDCRQHMRFECSGNARLMTQLDEDGNPIRQPSSWYVARNGKQGLQWAEAPPFSRACSCANNNSCLGSGPCNCDSGNPVDKAVDEGWNVHSQLLPVTGLLLGGIVDSRSSINVSVGALECADKMVWEPVSWLSRDARLVGQRSFYGRTFELSLQTIFTWETADGLHWFQLLVKDGRLVVEIVAGGWTSRVAGSTSVCDGKWHALLWQVSAGASGSQKISVDGRIDGKMNATRQAPLLLPPVYTWTIGSRTGRGSAGFAGVLRDMYLCGDEVPLARLVRSAGVVSSHGSAASSSSSSSSDASTVVVPGERGKCREGLCRNGAPCDDFFDSYHCNCTATPFGGALCEREYGVVLGPGSKLSIPWMHPAHATSSCGRVAFQTTAANVSLLRAKSLFAEASFNLSILTNGSLYVSAYDGFFFTHRAVGKPVEGQGRVNDDTMHELRFCATNKFFDMTVDEKPSIRIDANWTFFQAFNVWHFVDTNFTGCLSRLQVGGAFPLKNPKASRLNFAGDRIQFGVCPAQLLADSVVLSDAPVVRSELPPPDGDDEDGQEARADGQRTSGLGREEDDHIRLAGSGSDSGGKVGPTLRFVMWTPAVALALILLIALVLGILICWMRSRPEGVYKTNEQLMAHSPARSEEPLMAAHTTNFHHHGGNNGHGHHQHHHHLVRPPVVKEYFC